MAAHGHIGVPCTICGFPLEGDAAREFLNKTHGKKQNDLNVTLTNMAEEKKVKSDPKNELIDSLREVSDNTDGYSEDQDDALERILKNQSIIADGLIYLIENKKPPCYPHEPIKIPGNMIMAPYIKCAKCGYHY